MSDLQSGFDEMVCLHPVSVGDGESSNFNFEEQKFHKLANKYQKRRTELNSSSNEKLDIFFDILEITKNFYLNNHKDQCQLISALKIVKKCLLNIVNNPEVEKFRTFAVGTDSKFMKKVDNNSQFLSLLISVGFVEITESETQSFVILTNEFADFDLLKITCSILESELNDFDNSSEEKANSKNREADSKNYLDDPIYRPKKGFKKRQKRIENDQDGKKIISQPSSLEIKKMKLAEAAESRLGKLELINDHPKGGVTKGRETDFSKVVSLKEDLKKIRKEKHQKWLIQGGARRRVFTLEDIHRLRKEEQIIKANFRSSYSKNTELEAIGREALKFTNEFRARNKLSELKWHQKLCDIGYGHSKDMGDGKVPFAHVGFNERVKNYGFPHKGAAENLAMNYGVSYVAKCAVDGWIHSPGHRRNLLGKYNFCGIGVYKNLQGKYYLTQLFANA